MKIKKIMAILIVLIIIVNTLIPTITLATNEMEEKIEDTTTIIEDINKKEDATTEEETNENSTKNEIGDNEENITSENETIVDEEKNEEENIRKEDTNNDVEPPMQNTINKEIEEASTEEMVIEENENAVTDLSVSYRTHVEDIGWQNYVQNGEMAGTSGKSLRLEAMNIQLVNNEDKNLHIKYQVHVEDIGWQNWKTDGEMAGTSGKRLRLEAIKIYLDSSENYSIMYRVHVQDEGWQEWKTDGEMAGTEGKKLRLEAIQIKIVKKQKKGKLCIDTPVNGSTYYNSETSNIMVSGWKMTNVSNAYIKAYVDNKEVDPTSINYYERPDVIKAIIDHGTKVQNPLPGYNFNIDISNWNSGKHTIKIDLYSDGTILTTMSTTINLDKSLHVQYRTHVQDESWQNYVQDGNMAGTSGKSLRLEAMNIKLLNNSNRNLHIKYQVHVEEEGWQDWKTDGEMAGTSGKSLRLEAIKICLDNTEDYSIMYRVHVQDIGWQDWKTDGEMAGTSGKSLRLEAIQIKIVGKQKKVKLAIDIPVNNNTYYKFETSNISITGWKIANVSNTYIKAYLDNKEVDSTTIQYYERPDIIKENTQYGTKEQNPLPGYKFDIDINSLEGGNHTIKIEVHYKDSVIATDSRTFNLDINPHIKYSAHVEDIGWQEYVEDGAIIGTVGKSLRVEALKLQLINVPSTAHIKYRAYVDGKGWTDYAQDGGQAGTTGQKKMIEAIQIEIEGLDGYIIEYQAHVQSIGWQSWASNGMSAGTIEQGLRIEAAKFRIIKRENTVVPQVKYASHIAEKGWIDYCEDNGISGSTTSDLKLDAIKIVLGNSEKTNIKYQVHVQEKGWLDEVQNNAEAGTCNEENGIEAIKIELDGLDGYSIEYRVYIIGQGWQEWVCDGEMAGTTGENLQISAIQIKLNIKTKISKSNFNSLDESKYSGYKTLLRQVQNQHPDWIITIKYTGLDWNTVIENEYGFSGASPRSLTQYPYMNQWKSTEDDNAYDVHQNWYRASREAIAYMMDPRNSLEEAWIFQFQDLSSSAGTRTNIKQMVSGTFLDTDSIVNTIISVAQDQGISPFHLVSRILQEQGRDGHGVMNGYSYNGRTVYNLFNINVSGNSSDGITAGAQYAYERHWFTPETCIIGSAEFLKEKYISKGQSTLYFQKYNVVDQSNLYNHQYMQNIRAANDEGNTIYKSYRDNGLLNCQFEFVIPVYENMPSSPCARPAT